MARIDILRPHHLPPARARKLLEALAQELTTQFGATYAWAGDRMVFEKSGVSGAVELLPKAVHITSDLGFLMSPLKTTIENQINVFLDDLLAKETVKTTKKAAPASRGSAAKPAAAKQVGGNTKTRGRG